MANNPVINSFNAGELSPYMGARKDLSKYGSGCLELENFQVLPYGGVTRRPAVRHASQSRKNYKPVLVPFSFASGDSIVLELTDKDAYTDHRPPWANPRDYVIRFLLLTTDVRVAEITQSTLELSETMTASLSAHRCFLLNSTEAPNECSKAGVGISGVSLVEVPTVLVCEEVPQSLGGEIIPDPDGAEASVGITDISFVEFRFLTEEPDETGTLGASIEDIGFIQVNQVDDARSEEEELTASCTAITLILINPEDL
jgi:hypothetical protein